MAARGRIAAATALWVGILAAGGSLAGGGIAGAAGGTPAAGGAFAAGGTLAAGGALAAGGTLVGDRTPAGADARSGDGALAGDGIAGGGIAGAPAAAARQPIVVGGLTLAPCESVARAYCGRLRRPLDPTARTPGTIDIRFEWYPRRERGRPSLGTVVAAEGGPGYPSTGSRSYYLPIFEPLLDRRDFLLVDNRGTGLSGAIDCPPLQTGAVLTIENVGACGRSLGEAAAFYGSGAAADDLAAILAALETGPVDLYGNSYGTFFAETFAVRHPQAVRTLVLDGAYPVVGASPWYPQAAGRNRYALEVTCRRDPACAGRPGSPLARLEALLAEVRRRPITGTARDAYGRPIAVTVDGVSLAYLVFGNATGPVIFRELDAAIRAHFDAGDPAPLVRLIAEGSSAADSRDISFSRRYYSTGLFAAVSCTDYPQAYDMTAPAKQRRLERDRAVHRKKLSDPGLYAPFTIDEYLAMSIDYSVLDLCLEWPRPPRRLPPGEPIPPDAEFPMVPTLVLSGELDSITPPDGGADTAALFPRARWLLVRNAFHVVALDHVASCGARLVRRFMESGGDPGDVSCTREANPVRLVPAFATRLDAVAAARPTAGNRAGDGALKLAAVATAAAGDVLARTHVNYAGHGGGLRGGRFTFAATAEGYRFRLDGVRWTEDTTVDGTMTWNTGTGAVRADLRARGHGGLAGRLTVTWNAAAPPGPATIAGRIGGRRVAAESPAP